MTVENEMRPAWESRPPRLLGFWSVLRLNFYGLLLGIPVLVAVFWVSFQPLSWKTYVLPLSMVALALIFLPIGFGNTLVRRLGRKLNPRGEQEAFLVQLTAVPRVRKGLRAMLEDADDIGWVQVTDTHLRYSGDAIQFEIPLAQVTNVHLRNIGYRGLFIYGPKVCFAPIGLPGVQEIEFADRSSILLPQSRRQIRRLKQALKK